LVTGSSGFGGAIARHLPPGTRMVITTVHELRGSVGCVAMCAGGRMGSALVLELRH